MAVAERYATPRSIVLGRPLPAPGKPLWLAEDLDWAIAFEQYKASVCKRCGTRHEEWDGNPDAYVAVHERCPGEQALALSDEEIPEAERGRGAFSVLIPVDVDYWRREYAEAAERLGMKDPRRQVG
jgi:hypothetical protein